MPTNRELSEAIKPFAELAAGIPKNWPGECVPFIDVRDDDGRVVYAFLNYHGTGITGPTIDDYRKISRLYDELQSVL